MLKSKKNLFAVAIIIAAILYSTLIYKTRAVGLPFGGFVLTSRPCTCGGFLLTVSPPVGGSFMYYPGTPQFAYYSLPRAGVWVLGLYEPGGVCLDVCKAGCCPFFPATGVITPIVGTSL